MGWTRGDNMRLKHVDTGMYLSASGHTFVDPSRDRWRLLDNRGLMEAHIGRLRRECIFIKQTSILRDKMLMTSCDRIFCDIKISLLYFCLDLEVSPSVSFINNVTI